MSTVVIRNRDKEKKPLLELSEDARRRVKEHLVSVGIRVERLHPLIWPDDAVSACKPHMYAAWEFTTKSDILRKKRERMERHLRWKREDGVVQRRPIYVWVFWCPGISGCFEGWWTYLIGLKGQYRGGGHKGEVSGELFDQIKELFPVVDPMLPGIGDDWEQDEGWMKGFAKCYQRGKWCRKPQGKAPVWAEVQGDSIERLLGRAEWPVNV